jgi:hypothetical protein
MGYFPLARLGDHACRTNDTKKSWVMLPQGNGREGVKDFT